MTWLDILLAVPLCWLIFLGWKKGLVREIATLAGVLLGLWAAMHLSGEVAPMLDLDGESAILIAFIVLFLVSLVVAYLIGRLVESIMRHAKLSVVNRLLGALLGACKALVVLAILLNFIVMIDGKERLLPAATKEKSILYHPVYKTGNRLTAYIKDYIADHGTELKEALQ